MKKLASLLALGSIGLFSIGCNDAGVEEGPEPIPSETGTMEGGSGMDDTVIIEEETSDVPPTTDEVPPATPDAAFTPEPETETTEPALENESEGTAPALEESAEGTPSAEEAAEASETATPE